jgi:anti-sigma factor RsiW
MTEADVEILEMYLDDALSDQDLAAVARRLADEPVMAAELERLRGERDLRRQFFATLDPSDAAVERLLGRVDESIRRRTGWERQLKWGRWAAAAAACVALGFTTGYLGRSTSSQPGPNVAVNTDGQQPVQQVAENNNPDDTHGKIFFPGQRVAPTVPAAVQLTDDAGRVVAVQHFESLDKAKEFANDIQAWQERQRQMQNGNVVMMGGKF